MENRNLFVGNLGSNITDAELRQHFSYFGGVCQLYIDCPYRGASIELSGDKGPAEVILQPSQVFPERFMGEEVQCLECKEGFVLEEDRERFAYWRCRLVQNKKVPGKNVTSAT